MSCLSFRPFEFLNTSFNELEEQPLRHLSLSFLVSPPCKPSTSDPRIFPPRAVRKKGKPCLRWNEDDQIMKKKGTARQISATDGSSLDEDVGAKTQESQTVIRRCRG